MADETPQTPAAEKAEKKPAPKKEAAAPAAEKAERKPAGEKKASGDKKNAPEAEKKPAST